MHVCVCIYDAFVDTEKMFKLLDEVCACMDVHIYVHMHTYMCVYVCVNDTFVDC